MCQNIKFFLIPLPPSINSGYYVNNKFTRRKILSTKARTFQTVSTSLVKQQAHDLNSPYFTEPVSLATFLIFPDNRRRDVDNFNKGINDILTMTNLIQDDHLIYQNLVIKINKDNQFNGLPENVLNFVKDNKCSTVLGMVGDFKIFNDDISEIVKMNQDKINHLLADSMDTLKNLQY